MDITTLAATAGNALVTALVEDGWHRTRDAVAALWRRARPEEADATAQALATARDDLLAARREGDPGADEDQARTWARRFRRLLTDHPELAADLRAALHLPDTDLTPGAVHNQAYATGGSTVIQAGRDIRYHGDRS